MPKFRRKPVVIEAYRWDGNGPAALDWSDKVSPGISSGTYLFLTPRGVLFVHTLEGDMRATPGDMIICGVNKEFYFCKPDIFAKTYDAVVEEKTPGEKAHEAYLETLRMQELNIKICELGVCIHEEHQIRGFELQDPPQSYLEFLRHT